jgi:hypothetical protein
MWSGPVGELLMEAEQYVIVVSHIDDLIVDVLKVCSRSPVAFIGSSNPAAREAITRHNEHALQFLTTWPPPA